MSNYHVRLHPRLSVQLVQHAEFIARVSKPAALHFRDEFADTLHRLAENPYQFPPCDDPNLPPELYRTALFAKWYEVVFYVDGSDVFVEAVVDARSDNQNGIR